ncbi:MAG: bifunctional sugar phosphate isomerase/epimerase/4-hydroxyphenylpyruvate dioxygenase family protein [Alphaproteobacteria bacterium]
MRTAIATVSLSGDLAGKLDAIARAGFDAVELFESDFLAHDGSAAEVGRMARDQGLAIAAFQPFRDFECLPASLRARAFDRARRKLDLTAELGADLLLICSTVSPDALGGIDRAAADLRALGDLAAARGLRVGYEALSWGRFVSDHRDAWEIVRRADHPAIGLVLDSFHTLARGIDPESIRSIPGDRIFLVQLADAPRLDLDLLSWSRHFRVMPGQGDLDIARFMRAVEATGYAGIVSIEVFNDQFRAGSPAAVALDGRRSLVALEDALPGGRHLPAPPRFAGIDGVEFAVDEAAARGLEASLAALGFAPDGPRPVAGPRVWRQNGMTLVVDTSAAGFAHSFRLTHGPSIHALSLTVDDADRAMRRARAMMATPYADLPAVRGVGGGLLRFVDAAEDRAAAPTAGLLAIDHVAQSMDQEEMLSWLLFHRAVLGLGDASDTEVADPGGLIRSRALQDAEGRVRIVLNAADGARTAPARFRSEFFGSGVQHIAFAAADIFATARALRAAGIATLPIPRNYHDDLAARFALDDGLLAAMAAHGVLYDRDAAGEYLQLYTPAFADRFFFEIVERRGYRGFGAPNAPIRLAAQARAAPAVAA